MEEFRGRASVIIDTSDLAPRFLKDKLKSLYSEDNSGDFTVNIMSFGYKWGIPLDSDIVMDVRFLANPFYDPLMRTLTGEDHEVIEYVLNSPVTRSFTRRFLNLLKYLIPNYLNEARPTWQCPSAVPAGSTVRWSYRTISVNS